MKESKLKKEEAASSEEEWHETGLGEMGDGPMAGFVRGLLLLQLLLLEGKGGGCWKVNTLALYEARLTPG